VSCASAPWIQPKSQLRNKNLLKFANQAFKKDGIGSLNIRDLMKIGIDESYNRLVTIQVANHRNPRGNHPCLDGICGENASKPPLLQVSSNALNHWVL